MYTPYIAFSNNDKGLIDKFASLAQCGSIYYRQREGNCKPSYVWALFRLGEVKKFLEEIIPSLPSKTRQAELLLEFCILRESFSRKGIAMKLGHNSRTPREHEIFGELRKLNRKGITGNACS